MSRFLKIQRSLKAELTRPNYLKAMTKPLLPIAFQSAMSSDLSCRQLKFRSAQPHQRSKGSSLRGSPKPSLKQSSLAPLLALTLGCCAALGIAQSASAAERVVLKYGWFQRSVAVSDLSTLAETGEASSELRSYLRLAGQSPARLRRDLNRDVDVNPVTLDRLLNTPLGDAALDQITPAIHTESGTADRQALRAALVLAASEDENISIIEVLEEYPTSEVYLDGDRIVDAYRQIANIQQKIERWFGRLGF